MTTKTKEKKLCKATNCGFPSRKLNLCDAHWMQQRLGVELKPVRRSRKVLKRLALINSNNTGCVNCNCSSDNIWESK
jgi:hypothetical protein